MIHKNVCIGVTTYNRLVYLKKFINTWEKTKSPLFNWTLIIADDGSSDGTLEFLNKKQKEKLNYNLKIIFNNKNGVHYQTNTILNTSVNYNFDFGFKVDDDIFFIKSGWDIKYIETSIKYKLDHLVYFSKKWKKPLFNISKGKDLVSNVDALSSLGCFWTYTPNLIKSIGFFDHREFGRRGNGHIDYTVRACRAGFNNLNHLYDISGSEDFIDMQPREGYIQTISRDEYKKIATKDEQERRKQIILNPNRLYIKL
jgi:glycosyltransferase involved in cell wall biosynthesis